MLSDAPVPNSLTRPPPLIPRPPPHNAAGSAANYPKSLTNDVLTAGALSALRGMFGAGNITNPTSSIVTRWESDPYSWGSYSYFRKGCDGTERKTLLAPVNKLLYFAGEATNTDFAATVQGAYLSGTAAAASLIKDHPLK